MKVFNTKGLYNAKGKLLPFEDFKLFCDLENPKLVDEKLQRTVRHAESVLTKDIPLLPASLYREYVTIGNRANYEGPYFARRDMAVVLAVAEHYEKKGRFSEKLMDVVWAIMEESTWMIPAHLYCSPLYSESSLGPVFGNNALHGVDLFSAATCGTLAVVYHLCKDALDAIDPVICRKIEYMVKERGITNFLQIELWWGGALGNKINNWCPWILSNILLAAAIVEKDNYIREKVVTKSMSYLDNFFNCYKPDGGCDEGPAYWSAAGASLFDCLELIEDMSGGKIQIYDSELVKNIGDYIYKVNISGIRYVNFADCAPKTAPNPSMLIRFGTKCDSEFLTAFGKGQLKHGDYFLSQSHMYRSLKCLYSLLPEASECPMPLGTWLPDLQVMTARENSDNTKGTFLAAKGGNNDEMHNHNDCGNIMIYRNGEPVIIDTGVGQYTKQTFSPQRYELWFMQSGYHNLPSFGGVDQKNGPQYKATDVSYDEETHTLKCQLKEAYPAEAGIESYVRQTSLLDGAVTIIENIALKEEKEIDFHMMLASAPEIKGAGKIALPEGMTLTYDKKLVAEIEEFDPVGMDTKRTWDAEKLYRIHFRINTAKCKVKFTIK